MQESPLVVTDHGISAADASLDLSIIIFLTAIFYNLCAKHVFDAAN